jgi:hypothetical protein
LNSKVKRSKNDEGVVVIIHPDYYGLIVGQNNIRLIYDHKIPCHVMMFWKDSEEDTLIGFSS